VCIMFSQAAPTLAARCAVREAPAAAGISVVGAGDGRWDAPGEESLAPRWTPRFRREDLVALPAALLAVLELHDLEGVSFGEALVFAAQCERLQRLTLERLGDGTDGRSRLRGADLVQSSCRVGVADGCRRTKFVNLKKLPGRLKSAEILKQNAGMCQGVSFWSRYTKATRPWVERLMRTRAHGRPALN